MQTLPNHSFVLLLPNVVGHLAINLARTQSHRQRLSHIVLNCHRNGNVFVGGTNPYVRSPKVFKFARPQLRDLGS